MPIYQYECPKCEKGFEQIVSAKAADDVACPECGSSQVTRQFGVPAKPLPAATNCRGDGPPCGAPLCGRR